MYLGCCLCGAIKVELSGSIEDIIHCHCSLCRKNSGTAYATNGFINACEFKVLDPQKKLGTYEFKPGKNRYFCTVCASPIFSSNADNPSKLRIRLGIIDSQINETPLSHNFVSSKANWDNLDADLPRYDAFEPSRYSTATPKPNT
ncbi:MAG: GFA family protein [Paraglaciecola sp.]|uniref:GFA family protein n=1 Tax=Paraglaciecola sp. TaxID=1920173 RepID=UPI0032995A72